MHNARVLGLIPAKGASQRFPRKNLARLGGKSLLERALGSAMDSKVLTTIAVSSEDYEIRNEANRLGADVVLRRPANLAQDPAGVVDVALASLEELRRQGNEFDAVCILLPTAPLRIADDVRAAVALWHRVRPAFVHSVSEFEHTPFAALVKVTEDEVLPAFPEKFGKKSQEVPPAFRVNGAVHVLDVRRLRKTKSYFTPPLVPYFMPRMRSVDVDTPEDLLYAQFLVEWQESSVTCEP